LTLLSDFLDSVSGGVATSWLALVRVPAVIFWAIGALAWWYAHPHVDVAARVQKLTGTEQILLVALAAAALIGSSALFDQLSRPLLRGLEGYWPRFLAPVSGWLISRAVRRQRTLQEQWQGLDGLDRADQREAERREAEQRDADQTAVIAVGEPDPQAVAGLALRARRKARLDAQLHGYPAEETRTMPTRLGNVLRASETYPAERYGLDAVIAWPRLWLLLPDGTQQEIAASRRALDQSVTTLAAFVVALVWLPWAWWVAPLAVIAVPLVYQSFAVPRAAVLAELVTAAFDLNRMALYRALRFPLPGTADAELASGPALTEYLWRGFPPVGFQFTAGQDAGTADQDS
jgi:hypothetical protein